MNLMNTILQPCLDTFVIVFTDDILVLSEFVKAHKDNLRVVLNTLRSHKLYAKLSRVCLDARQ